MSKLSPITEIEFTSPPAMPKDIGTPGELRWIETDQLVIDHSYQRPILKAGENNIRRIIENFNWALFAPLVVAPRENGQFAIIDGQHKATAAKARGLKKLPCLVIKADYALQAKAFSVINGHVTRLDTLLVFRARIAAGDAAAVAINNAARRAGAIIAPYPKPATIKKVNETLAVGSIENIFQRFGADAVHAALSLLVQANSPELMGKAAIRGAGMCFGAHPLGCKKKSADLLQALKPPGIQRLFADSVAGRSGGDGFLTFSVKLAEKFQAAFGDGGTPKPSAAPKKPKPTAAKAPDKTEAIRRAEEAHRLSLRQAPKAPAAPKVDERALIDAHIKKHGVRHFDTADTADDYNLVEWLKRRGFDVTRNTGRGMGVTPFRVKEKPYTREQFFALVNAEPEEGQAAAGRNGEGMTNPIKNRIRELEIENTRLLGVIADALAAMDKGCQGDVRRILKTGKADPLKPQTGVIAKDGAAG